MGGKCATTAPPWLYANDTFCLIKVLNEFFKIIYYQFVSCCHHANSQAKIIIFLNFIIVSSQFVSLLVYIGLKCLLSTELYSLASDSHLNCFFFKHVHRYLVFIKHSYTFPDKAIKRYIWDIYIFILKLIYLCKT